MFFPLARFHTRPLSFKALILAFTTSIFNEKGVIRDEEEKVRIPVDVRASNTSVLYKLSERWLFRTESRFREGGWWKTVSFEEQIMPEDKYLPIIFSHQM